MTDETREARSRGAEPQGPMVRDIPPLNYWIHSGEAAPETHVPTQPNLKGTSS